VKILTTAGGATLVALSLMAEPAWAADFEFAVIGDTRPRFESDSFQPFEGLITRINGLKPAFVVNLGDLIYGYGTTGKEKQWDKYQTVIKTIQVPYHQLPGNHDTHSKEARKIYGQRFGKFYDSFDYGDCHFVLLDNTEEERWGYLGPVQLAWLRNDLKETRARSVFVFLHFPVWEPERVMPEFYDFWAKTLHPLFKESRVRAVFGGHYHAYGPTREFDGIRYFITGGGGAELRPEYEKAGGEYHFMKVHVLGDTFDVRVVTEHQEMTDAEADVIGGLQFANRNVSRIAIESNWQGLKTGIPFTVSLNNPYPKTLTGQAEWILDTSAFSVQPPRVGIDVPARGTAQYHFVLKALQDTVSLQSLPRLEFNVVSEQTRRRFHQEIRLVQQLSTPRLNTAPVVDGQLSDWEGVPAIKLGEGLPSAAELRSGYDARNLYLALAVPKYDTDEAKELGFSDEVQVGMARRLNDIDFGGDRLRLGFNPDSREVKNRTPGPEAGAVLAGATCAHRTEGQLTSYEIVIPLRLIKNLGAGTGGRLILDLSFPAPESGTGSGDSANPGVNTLFFRIRYGSDLLAPVYFIGLNFERTR